MIIWSYPDIPLQMDLQGHGSLSDLDLGLIVSVGSIRTSKQIF